MLHTYSKKRAVSPCVTLEHARAVYDCVLSVQYACTSFKLNIERKLTTDVKDFLTVWSWWLTTSFCQRWLESMQLADPWRALYRWRIWKHFYVTLWRLHKLQTTTNTYTETTRKWNCTASDDSDRTIMNHEQHRSCSWHRKCILRSNSLYRSYSTLAHKM